MTAGILKGSDDLPRCWWAGQTEIYQRYHDEEWGRPTKDDRWLFEKICLEGFQSGLSWLTILNKRENFRRAFADFEAERIARFTQRRVEMLMGDTGIVRNRKKIESTIHNAKRLRELRDEFGSLAAYVWRFEPSPASRPKRFTKAALMKLSVTDESKSMSKDLKKRGWSFVGPTTLYAFMQSAGVVNDHLEGCCVRATCERQKSGFKRPR